jgi:hypothetical protein
LTRSKPTFSQKRTPTPGAGPNLDLQWMNLNIYKIYTKETKSYSSLSKILETRPSNLQKMSSPNLVKLTKPELISPKPLKTFSSLTEKRYTSMRAPSRVSSMWTESID